MNLTPSTPMIPPAQPDRLTLSCSKSARHGGHLYAVIQALWDEELVHVDTLILDDQRSRFAFAENICARLDGRSPSMVELEHRLLSLLRGLTHADSADSGHGGLAAEGEEPFDQQQDDEEKTVSEVLVEIASQAMLLHDPAGDAYARLSVDGHAETWRIRSQSFRKWLAREFFHLKGKVPNASALGDALNVIEAMAQFKGPCHPVYLRVAPDGDGGLYIDLGDAAWQAVHVTASGWEVVACPPVFFRRSSGMLPLPEPTRGGNLDDLRAFVNVSNENDWTLVKAWLVAAVRDRGPFPVLVLRGQQGSAKTTQARMLRSLVDPAMPELRSDPRNLQDLMIAAQSNWVVAFDNISSIKAWLSDALCRLATGGGWATRELYTDRDEVLFEAQRPALLTGITEFVVRGDLLDRSIQIVLPEIPDARRRDERSLWTAFEAARPRLFGALLDSVAGALRELPAVTLKALPRMADFALWAVAAEQGRGETPRFMAAYGGMRQETWQQGIEGSAVGSTLMAFIETRLAGGPWTGTADELRTALDQRASEQERRDRFWPKTPRAMRAELDRLAPALRGLGVHVTHSREGRQAKRIITLQRVSGEARSEKG